MTDCCLVIMAGLPATGKSTLAQALAEKLAGIVLNKDLIRAALFPEPWIDYSQSQDDFCIELLLQTAAYLINQTTTPPPFLFLDGRAFAYHQQLDRVINWAHQTNCNYEIIQTTCSDATAEHRLQSTTHPAKNRTYALYLAIKSRFEPIPHPHLTVNTDQPLDAVLTKCQAYLLTD